jgi:predicted transcriptional regulator
MTSAMNQELNSITLSILRIELLAFFQANPHTRDTADGLALRLHRPRHEVETALNTLSALGVVEIGGTEKVTIYRLRNGDLINNYFKDENPKIHS